MMFIKKNLENFLPRKRSKSLLHKHVSLYENLKNKNIYVDELSNFSSKKITNEQFNNIKLSLEAYIKNLLTKSKKK